jgi:cytochrome c oxidase cbb3-type subunit 4
MDPTIAGADGVSTLGVIRGVITALTMAVYGGIFYWAYWRGNRDRFEQDALMPFADEPEPPVELPTQEVSR